MWLCSLYFVCGFILWSVFLVSLDCLFFILPSVFSNVYLKMKLHVCTFIDEKYDKMIGAINRAG
jgi:hypothetical protein